VVQNRIAFIFSKTGVAEAGLIDLTANTPPCITRKVPIEISTDGAFEHCFMEPLSHFVKVQPSWAR
jgi:hypothetical protein